MFKIFNFLLVSIFASCNLLHADLKKSSPLLPKVDAQSNTNKSKKSPKTSEKKSDSKKASQNEAPKKDNSEVDEKSKRRAKEAPFDEVFPSTEYLGPTIGVPNSDPVYPLTKYMWRRFSLFKENDIRIYGWIEPSYNKSSSNNSNLPMGYDFVPNKLELDQFILKMERTPDTVQTCHIDWGFCLTSLYGIDYRFTTAQGMFSNQLIDHNNLYGYDLLEAYGQIYFPYIAEGMLMTFGRYFSPADLETPLAPLNYLFTHSLMVIYDAVTQTGVNFAIKIDDQWSVLLGIHAGDDLMPWAQGRRIPTLLAMARWVSNDNNDSLWFGIDSFNGGKFKAGHDNLQEFVFTWTHRFCKEFFIATEAYYMYQRWAPKGGTCINGPTRTWATGGGCGPLISGTSSEWGIMNFIELKISDKDFVSYRTVFFNDQEGERTGFATPYMSFTLGMTHQFTDLIEVRPEIRHEFAFHDTPYDRGTRSYQTTFNIDLIGKF